MRAEARRQVVLAEPNAPGTTAGRWIDAPVVMFDVEGTLVDAVPLTLRCWSETLAEFGRGVAIETLQPLSGMDGRDMLARLFPGLTDEAAQQILKSQGKRYRSHYLSQVRPFPEVAEVFELLRGTGRAIGLATDCSSDELDHYVALTGIGAFIAASACGDQVDHGKPHPDLMRLALDKLGARPQDAVMVGDTPFDILAARSVGVPGIGLLTGNFQEADLIRAGAKAALPDIAALAGKLRPLLQGGDRKAS